MSEDRLNETVRLLDAQCGQLKEIQQRYYTQYDAVFDRQGAIETTKRWHHRTARIIHDRVSAQEAAKFYRLIIPVTTILGSWDFDEWLKRFHTFINDLIDDFIKHPEDPAYDRLLNPPELHREIVDGTAGESLRYDVFLSYQTTDKDEAREIFRKIEQAGKKCFLAEKSLQPGDIFTEKIREALKSARELWVLLSPNSIKSDWVNRECSAAWGLEKKNRAYSSSL